MMESTKVENEETLDQFREKMIHIAIDDEEYSDLLSKTKMGRTIGGLVDRSLKLA